MVVEGKEDYESDVAKQLKGGLETYTLSEKNGATQLDVASDMSEDAFVSMSDSWKKALHKVKELSEK